MKRRHCSPSYHQDNLYNDVCDVSYETICTTIIATKYVKVSVALSYGGVKLLLPRLQIGLC